MKTKLRVLLYTSFIITVIIICIYMGYHIFGAIILSLIPIHILVICFVQLGIIKKEVQYIKVSLIGALLLTTLHICIFIFLLYKCIPLVKISSLWLIPSFIEILILTLIAYSDYLIRQLWKQISLNGDFERSPSLALPSISLTAEDHQTQGNGGYEEEDVPVVAVPMVETANSYMRKEDPPTYEDLYGGDDGHKITRKEGNSKVLSEERNSELLAEFECPVCYNLLAPPLQILQCSAGHVVCSACKDQGIESCPTCRNKIIGRAHHMENIATLFFDDLK